MRDGRNDSECFLCGKSRQEVKKLILGEKGGICFDCVALCSEIIAADAAQAGGEPQRDEAV